MKVEHYDIFTTIGANNKRVIAVNRLTDEGTKFEHVNSFFGKEADRLYEQLTKLKEEKK